MKKLILTLTVAAFAVAVQAGGDACAAKDKPCCAKAAEQTKATATKTSEQAKAGCCPAAKQTTTTKATKPLPSPKATSLASK